LVVHVNVPVVPGEETGEIPKMPLERDEKSIFNYGVCDPLWDIDTLPLTYNDSRWFAFIFEADEGDLKRVTPRPLEVVGNRVEWWYVVHLVTRLGPYYEFGVTVPCIYRAPDGTVYKGGYYPYMYLTAAAPTDAGRVLGFPKKHAYIMAMEQGGDVRNPPHKKYYFNTLIARNGYIMHTATGKYDDKVKAKDIAPVFWGDPEQGRFNMKIVSNSDITQTKWELTYLPATVEGKMRFALKPETIRTASPDAINWFGQGTPFDNMCTMVPPKKLLGLVTFTFDLIIPVGQVLWTETRYRTPTDVAAACLAKPYRYHMRQQFPKPIGV